MAFSDWIENQNISPVTQIGGHMGPVLECMCFQQGNQYPIIIVTIVSNVFSSKFIQTAEFCPYENYFFYFYHSIMQMKTLRNVFLKACTTSEV